MSTAIRSPIESFTNYWHWQNLAQILTDGCAASGSHNGTYTTDSLTVFITLFKMFSWTGIQLLSRRFPSLSICFPAQVVVHRTMSDIIHYICARKCLKTIILLSNISRVVYLHYDKGFDILFKVTVYFLWLTVAITLGRESVRKEVCKQD